jgi:small subunit ribosomal protein S20
LANHKSAIKRNRQNPVRCERNKGYKTLVKNATKRVLNKVEEENVEDAQTALKHAEKTISKVGRKGAIHRRAASRKVSNLAKLVNRLATPA